MGKASDLTLTEKISICARNHNMLNNSLNNYMNMSQRELEDIYFISEFDMRSIIGYNPLREVYREYTLDYAEKAIKKWDQIKVAVCEEKVK